MKDNTLSESITEAATAVLLRGGLAGWSVNRVAEEAGCAKGLVHYHHGTKRDLLGRVAARIAATRQAHRVKAVAAAGPEALDLLWRALLREVRSGEFAAWCALVAAPDLASPPRSAVDAEQLASAISEALELPPWQASEALLLTSALDGLQLALLLGAGEAEVQEAYHRLWLTLLP